MDKQIIISIGRQYGSCGHLVAKRIAEKLNISLYDKNILQEIAEKINSDYEELKKFDEKPRNVWFSRRLGEHSNSIEEATANMQFAFLRKKAEAGESYVVVGRCADSVLADETGLVSIFICADMEDRINRVIEADRLSEHEAKFTIARMDKKRKEYHDAYSAKAWGVAEAYDMCLNISGMSIDEAADFIISYIDLAVR